MSNKSIATIATMTIDIGRHSFHAANGSLYYPPITASKHEAATAELSRCC